MPTWIVLCHILQEEEGWPNSSSSSNNGKRNNNGVAAERDPAGSGVYTASRPGVWRLKGGSLRVDDASQLPPLMLVRRADEQRRAGGSSLWEQRVLHRMQQADCNVGVM
jgi:hypothetical protein